MMHRSAVVWLIVMVGAVAVAQEDERARAGVTAPAETDITLPEAFLEVEELLIETVEATLPQPPDLVLATVSVPLPTEEELRISDALFELPGPDQTGLRTEPAPGESSFFADGVLGTGSNYHILGSLSLFKLGADPRFRFEFAHQSIDGYQFKDPGSGYFEREDTIRGWVTSAIARRMQIEAEGRFHDREEGLQGNPDFYSVGHRYLSGSTELRFAAGDRVDIGLGARGGLSERILTVKDDADPPREDEAYVRPALWIAYNRARSTYRIDGQYELRTYSGGELDTLHALSGALSADLVLTDQLFAEAAAGVYRPLDEGLHIPFRLGMTANLDDQLSVGLSGGYRVLPQRFFDLWQRVPMIDFDTGAEARPKVESAWFGRAAAAWATFDRRLTLEAAAEYALRDNAVDLLPFDAVENRFPYRQTSLTTLTPQLELTWRWRFLELGAGWQANLIDRTVLDPAQTWEASAQAVHASERFGAGIDSRMDVYDDPVVPRLGAGAFFKITEGVQFEMELRDLLAPGMPDGRPQIGDSVSGAYPFIEPGLRLILKAQVSL
ncbi:MAG: hypothetical protein EA384_02425 [Spirochaetaceae bacterium]|nr:MAG: hypothetical protein EA384_02425 [Spirochaetaceae bacterium]